MADAPSKGPEAKGKSIFDLLNEAFDKKVKNLSKARKDVGKGAAEVLVAASDEHEKIESAFEATHETSKYLLPESKKVVIDAAQNYLLGGSVDRVAFRKAAKREDIIVDKEPVAGGKEHEINWYEDMQRGAKRFLELQDNVEVNFPSLRDASKKARAMEIVKTMSLMGDFTDAAWAKMIQEKGYTDNEVFGSEGAYQLLLAFQRSLVGVSSESSLPGNEKYKIRLEIATKAGKSDADRYSRILATKGKKAAVAPPVKPQTPPVAPPVKPQTPPVTPPVKPQTPPVAPPVKPQTPPVAPKAAEAPKESPEAATIREMLEKLKTAGFEIVIAPSKFEQGGYAKYNADPKTPKRIVFSLNADGTYTYQMVTLPDGNPDLSGKSVDVMKIKGDLDQMKYSDKLKVLKEDFLHVPGYQIGGMNILKGKVPGATDSSEYEPNTYAVIIKDQKYKNITTGVISAPFDAEFLVTFHERLGYKGNTKKELTPIRPDSDPKAFIQRAIERAYLESLKK